MCDKAYCDGYHDGLYQNVVKMELNHQAKGDDDEQY